MDTFRRTIALRRWAGATDDLAEVASVARDEVQKWGFPGDVDVDVDMGDLKAGGDSFDLVVQLREDELRTLRGISISIDRPFSGSGFLLQARRGVFRRALEVVVVHTDRTQVEGLARRVEDLLNRGSRWPRWYSNDRVSGIAGVGTGLIVGTLVGSESPSDAQVVMSSFGALIALAPLVIAFLVPTLELLPRGRRTRIRRFGVLATTLFVGVAGSLIAWALVQAAR